jgi:hypothetical protein
VTPIIATLFALTVIVTLVRRRRRRLDLGRLPRRLLPRPHPTRRRRRAEEDARRLLAALTLSWSIRRSPRSEMPSCTRSRPCRKR